jgi:hypothetical protein
MSFSAGTCGVLGRTGSALDTEVSQWCSSEDTLFLRDEELSAKLVDNCQCKFCE